MSKLLERASDLLGLLANAEALDPQFLREKADEARSLVKEIEAAKASEVDIQVARDMYSNGEIEVDDNATTSESDEEGIWISAWLFVYDADREDDDE